MGAGSAKGVKAEEGEDGDRSSNSSEEWANDQPATEDAKKLRNNRNNNSTTFAKTLVEISEPGVSTTEHHDKGKLDDKKEELKKKTRFGFPRKKEDGEELANGVNDDEKKNISDKRNADKNNKEASKKEADKKGFRLFQWRKEDKKSEDKDDALDEDINELEKTFDSLGIVGKNMWGNEAPNNRKEALDDLELLEPMRKRKNVRVRGPKNVTTMGGSGGSSNGSTGSKRTFKFSWETENEEAPTTTEEDEWEYKAVVIEGFDIEKFRKANLRDSVFDSTSLPNAIGSEDDPKGTKSPLRYDQTEQHILATIERDFLH